MSEHLKNKLKNASSEPGVYLFKDKQNNILYIGKARNLKKRLASYFKTSSLKGMGTKTGVLINKIAEFDTIITKTEKEALILESTLIKKHKPIYNIYLRDDKQYPSLKLDIQNIYPHLSVVRKLKKDGAIYFGPYTSSNGVNQTLKIINKTFKLRKCKTKELKRRSRPCINFQIGVCLGPCCNAVDINAYNEIVAEVILFLKGRTPELIYSIKEHMYSASDRQEYELASVLRDKIIAIEKTLEKQIAVTSDLNDRDVIAIAQLSVLSVITLLVVRGGYLLGTRHFEFEQTISAKPDLIREFLNQYYEKNTFIPKEILISMPIQDAGLIEEWILAKKDKKTKIIYPQRGEKAKLVLMAEANAENRLKEQLASEKNRVDILNRLQNKMNLKKLPVRIECFDNSNISSSDPVAGMVVFEKGKPLKKQYRKFTIKTVKYQDDYAYMEEVLKRRYVKEKVSEPYPDLLLIDGGKGQLNIGIKILKELKLYEKISIAGIAKKDDQKGEKEDKIFIPERLNPVNFGREGDLILFLQRIRNEAHRFALAYHRKKRSSTVLRSIFDSIPGIGEKRKKLLLKHFGSISTIRDASIDELSQLPGMNSNVAKVLKQRLIDASNV
ncbi:MAG: excinuclease ABC subunit UvrC [Deltaproteobacteria bacterium]|nr:excinuclease ABC subunit UvrC [Deltaproteobacteria bacterium]